MQEAQGAAAALPGGGSTIRGEQAGSAAGSPSRTLGAQASATHSLWPPRPGRLPLWGGWLVFALVLAYAWTSDLYLYVGDDAGITLRYAERIAAGKGFTYNDGEAVNGGSNPLYILSEALLVGLGVRHEFIVRGIAAVGFAGACALIFSTFARFYSLVAGLFGVFAMLAFTRPFDYFFDGLETPWVSLLAALLFRALHSSNPVWTGAVLGVLVANKLDGALAAIAFTIVFLVQRRAFPIKAAAIALLTAAPMFVYLLVSFGSIFPNSMATKLAKGASMTSMQFDPLWMHKMLTRDHFSVLYWAAWASFLWLALARSWKNSLPILVIQVWFLSHMTVYASINLGGPTTWYGSSPTLHAVILSTFVVHALSTAVVQRGRLAFDPLVQPRRTWIVGGLLLGALLVAQGSPILGRLKSPSIPWAMPPSTSHELARQAGGAWLRKHTSGKEEFTSFCGLPAFEYEGPYYDVALLNVHPDPSRERLAAYDLVGPEPSGDPLVWNRAGRSLVAAFSFDASAERYVVYAARNSELVAKGITHFDFPLPPVWRARNHSTAESERWLWRKDDLLLPSASKAFFEIRSPHAPTLMLRPHLVSRNGRPASPGLNVLLTVVINRTVQHTQMIDASVTDLPVLVTPSLESPGGTYEFMLRLEPQGELPAENSFVLLEDVALRQGEPLQVADFKLLYERCRQRIERVAKYGPPFGFWDR